MTIIIDACAFSAVFDPKNSEHEEFEPVFNWIDKGKGSIVYGGSKYENELNKISRWRKLIKLYKDRHSVYRVDKNRVDEKQKEVEQMTADTDCDDPHIIAMFIVSKCRLFCSNDKRADKHIKNRALYPKGQKLPSIYRSRKNKTLLCDNNIVDIQNKV